MVLCTDLKHNIKYSCQSSVINIDIMDFNTSNGILALRKRRNFRRYLVEAIEWVREIAYCMYKRPFLRYAKLQLGVEKPEQYVLYL